MVVNNYRADSRFAPSQWEMPLLCNNVSHWLGASLNQPWIIMIMFVVCMNNLFCIISALCWDTLHVHWLTDVLAPTRHQDISKHPWWHACGYSSKADSRFVPSQWETALLCNDVSHWVGANLESTLSSIAKNVFNIDTRCTYQVHQQAVGCPRPRKISFFFFFKI